MFIMYNEGFLYIYISIFFRSLSYYLTIILIETHYYGSTH